MSVKLRQFAMQCLLSGAQNCTKLLDIFLLLAMIRTVEGSVCEPIQIPMCQSMPYNITQMPNLLHHSTQQNARLVLDQFQQLVASNCSRVLVFYLCSMFTPVCPVEFRQEMIPPCRGVCEQARQGCEPVMLRHKLSWPAEMDCSQLPAYDQGVCITPEALESSPPTVNSTKHKSSKRTDCQCVDSGNVTTRKSYIKRHFDFVIGATFKLSQGGRGRPALVQFRSRNILKTGSVPVTLNKLLTMWSPTGCWCLKLRRDQDYLLMGYEDPSLKVLLLDQRSVIQPWKKTWPKHIKKWEKRVKKRRSEGTSSETV